MQKNRNYRVERDLDRLLLVENAEVDSVRRGRTRERRPLAKESFSERAIFRFHQKSYSKALDLMNHGRSDTDGGHDTLLIPIHGGARLGSIDRDLGHRDGKCFHIYSVL